jgi:hypothetical protein
MANQMKNLGPRYASNVELDRDMAQELKALLHEFMWREVSRAHVYASMMRVLRYQFRSL